MRNGIQFLKNEKNADMCAMDVKLNQTRTNSDASAQQSAKRKPMFSFVQELKEELKKVSWTSKEELIVSTKAVVCATFFLGMGIYLFDLVIKGALDAIAQLVRLIFG